MTLSIQYVNKIHKHFLPKNILSFWLKSTLLILDKQKIDCDINIRFVDSYEGQELNNAYRGKDYATNVLTFAYKHTQDYVHSDIVLCTDVVEKEASEQNKALFAHYAHLIIHGILHSFSYEHETEEDNNIMQALEIKILNYIGLLNPY